MKESSVFFGTPASRLVTAGLCLIVVLILFAFTDRAFAKYEDRQGTLGKYWYQGGTMSFGNISTPKQNEQGAQTPVITASHGRWFMEVRTSSSTEIVECSQRPGKIGQTVTYRQKFGLITKAEYGLPVCLESAP